MAHVGKLPKINRFITTHDPTTGKAVFSSTQPAESRMVALQPGNSNSMGFALSYATNTFPVQVADDADLATYTSFLETPPGLVIGGGTVLRHVDFAPARTGVMHRTVSLDYGVVLEGEIDAVLDSGETRRMRRGDVCIQRGTMHAWRNPSDTEWCRMLFVLQPIVPLQVGGETLKEDLGTITGIVKPSI
jgi:quercetin dioxygenase-like cupin family protein